MKHTQAHTLFSLAAAFVLLVPAVIFSAGCEKKESVVPAQIAAAASETAPAATPAATTAALPRLVDLGAKSCVPCRMMAPILEDLQKTRAHQFTTVFYDVWQDNSKAKEYGISIIPTQIFFDKDGRELFRHEGFLPKEDILKKWRDLGYDFDKKD